ncbi:hypothetical protein PACTADRAFT_3464 [Pachysolen tannophilus NRRL Y-2460]|uniref:Uncharacterized protein n=1 Tax=Pachysolen tannophilus NRRL Y-2460 TaxID=669874 RepID=A0A1E4TSC9_PACTA|nr:hypothetical protein PACTADRAFT_3464 [Pachysolen tannophilus NRRL Y-2460]
MTGTESEKSTSSVELRDDQDEGIPEPSILKSYNSGNSAHAVKQDLLDDQEIDPGLLEEEEEEVEKNNGNPNFLHLNNNLDQLNITSSAGGYSNSSSKTDEYTHGGDEDRDDEEEDEDEDEDRYDYDYDDDTDQPPPQKLRPVDQISTVKPVVNYQDKLWTQIDILDDVKQMSLEVSKNGSFFDSNHSESLRNLKNSQLKLLANMIKAEKLMDSEEYHKIWNVKSNLRDDNAGAATTQATGAGDTSLNSGIDDNRDLRFSKDQDDLEQLKENLFNREHFRKIGDSITSIKADLENVKYSIKKVDETTKDMWDNNDFSYQT